MRNDGQPANSASTGRSPSSSAAREDRAGDGEFGARPPQAPIDDQEVPARGKPDQQRQIDPGADRGREGEPDLGIAIHQQDFQQHVHRHRRRTAP